MHHVLKITKKGILRTWIQSKAANILRLDKEQKENLLFNLIEHNAECKLDSKALEEMLEIFDINAVLKDELKKENLIKVSIKNSGGVFLNYLLSKGYVDKVSPAIIKDVLDSPHYAASITKFLKKSIGVEELLTAMHEKHMTEVQAQKAGESISFASSPTNPDTIIARFIKLQLIPSEQNRVGDPIIQKLVDKLGMDAIGKIMIETNLIVSAEVTQMPEKAKNKLLAITTFPTLCVSILSHYGVINFSEC